MDATEPPSLPRGLRVLVLEDETLVAMLLEDMLTELGCQVVGPVTTVEAALGLVEAEAPQLALLDISLSYGQSGYDVAEKLAAQGVPFAFVTGHGPGMLQPRFKDRPALQKPFHMAALVKLVRELASVGER